MVLSPTSSSHQFLSYTADSKNALICSVFKRLAYFARLNNINCKLILFNINCKFDNNKCFNNSVKYKSKVK